MYKLNDEFYVLLAGTHDQDKIHQQRTINGMNFDRWRCYNPCPPKSNRLSQMAEHR